MTDAKTATPAGAAQVSTAEQTAGVDKALSPTADMQINPSTYRLPPPPDHLHPFDPFRRRLAFQRPSADVSPFGLAFSY